MKRIIAVSDSHGNLTCLKKAISLAAEKGTIDIFVFLGDGASDLKAISPALLAHNPQMRIIAVRGNNDFSSLFPEVEEFTICGRSFLATHGHRFHVRTGTKRLASAALDRGASVALYGHTHTSLLLESDGVLLINPGAICNSPGRGPAFAEITIEEDGFIKADLIPWAGNAF